MSGHKVLPAIKLARIYTKQSLSLGTCAQDPGNKARVSGSQQDAHEFLVLTFLIGGAQSERVRH